MKIGGPNFPTMKIRKFEIMNFESWIFDSSVFAVIGWARHQYNTDKAKKYEIKTFFPFASNLRCEIKGAGAEKTHPFFVSFPLFFNFKTVWNHTKEVTRILTKKTASYNLFKWTGGAARMEAAGGGIRSYELEPMVGFRSVLVALAGKVRFSRDIFLQWCWPLGGSGIVVLV